MRIVPQKSFDFYNLNLYIKKEFRGIIKTLSLCRIGVMAAYDPSKVKMTVRVRYSAHGNKNM